MAIDPESTEPDASTSPPTENRPVPIALLEDSPLDGALIQQILQAEGYEVRLFDNGQSLLAALSKQVPFSLLLLDWELPGINGLEALHWIRSNKGHALPIIFVTNRSLESDIVQGLSAGADDYITKPVRKAELVARVKVQLRHGLTKTAEAAQFTTGVFSVDMTQREIRIGDELITLTPKEFDLAALFLRHPWRLFSRDNLSTLVWNRELVSTSRTLDTHLSNVRKKCRFGPATHTLLSASYALGYRLELLDHV
ncbi:Two-component system response regulator BaeR OS=Castellaniella defragrans OX=75697 GN=HNR28_001717 PE=4 SV=1 [Castellaniella defragrans]